MLGRGGNAYLFARNALKPLAAHGHAADEDDVAHDAADGIADGMSKREETKAARRKRLRWDTTRRRGGSGGGGGGGRRQGFEEIARDASSSSSSSSSSSWDDADEWESKVCWHVVMVSGGRREQSYANKLLEAFRNHFEDSSPNAQDDASEEDDPDEDDPSGMQTRNDEKKHVEKKKKKKSEKTFECIAPIIRVCYPERTSSSSSSSSTSSKVGGRKMVKKVLRWPASDVLWVRCAMDEETENFIRRQPFTRTIFSPSHLGVDDVDAHWDPNPDNLWDSSNHVWDAFTDLLVKAKEEEERKGGVVFEIANPMEEEEEEEGNFANNTNANVSARMHQLVTQCLREKYHPSASQTL